MANRPARQESQELPESNVVVFDPTPIPVDRTWGFHLILPSGKPDMVSGFTSEPEAKAWLASNQCDERLKTRGYVRDKT